MKLIKKICSLLLALAMTVGVLTLPAVTTQAAPAGTGGTLVHQGAYTGRKGVAAAYLSDLYGTDKVVYEHSTDSGAPFEKDASFQGSDSTRNYPIYIWNASHSVNVVSPVNHPSGRELTTTAEGTQTFCPTDIVLGYQGKRFAKGLGGHLVGTTETDYAPSAIVFDISEVGLTHFYAIAGLTGDAANRPKAEGSAHSYGVTFAIYGSDAETFTNETEFTLIASVDEIGGYGASVAESKTYNTAEFDVDVTGYKYLKLEAVSSGGASGGSYAWGDCCFYSAAVRKSTIGKSGAPAGKTDFVDYSSVKYLSDLYSTESKVSSFVIGSGNSESSPRDFKLDENWDSQLFVWTGSSETGSTARKQVTSGNSPRNLTITEADSTTHNVDYTNTEIAIGYRGTKYAKGLAGIVSPSTKKSASVIYNLQGLGEKYFYSVVGMTGAANTNPASGDYTYKLTFEVYGSKGGTNEADFELITYASDIRAYLVAEFNVDISSYKYLKLVTYSNGGNSGGSFVWADACLYKTLEKTPNITSSAIPVGHSEATNITYLSDVYSTERQISHFVIGENDSEANPRDFKMDTNWDGTVYVWAGQGSNRWAVTSNYATGRSLSIVSAPGAAAENITYYPDDVVAGFYGTRYEKALAGHSSKNTNTPASVVFDIQGLEAEYFYAVAGLTGEGNANNTTKFKWKLGFNVYASTTGTDAEDFFLIAYATDIRAYLTAEFNVPVTGYKYIKLETVNDSATNNSSSFVWADACVYNTTPIVENKMTNVSVTAAANLTLHVLATTTSDVTAPKVRFSREGATPVVATGVSTDGKWLFEYPSIYSQFMNTTITLELLDDENETLETKTYSIKAYCDGVHELGQTAEGLESLGMTAEKFALLDTLMADMLEYGAAAQIYTGRDTNNPANASAWVSTAKTQSFTAPASDTTSSAHSQTDKIRSASIRIKNDVGFLIRVSAENATKLIISDGENEAVYNLATDALSEGSAVYRIIGAGMLATDFDTVYTFTLADDSVTYHTVTYSVNSYVASKCNNSNAALSGIVRALYNYGVSAEAYIN